MNNKQYYIVIKFGRYQSKVKNMNRMRYEGRKQKTFKVDKDTLMVAKDEADDMAKRFGK